MQYFSFLLIFALVFTSNISRVLFGIDSLGHAAATHFVAVTLTAISILYFWSDWKRNVVPWLKHTTFFERGFYSQNDTIKWFDIHHRFILHGITLALVLAMFRLSYGSVGTVHPVFTFLFVSTAGVLFIGIFFFQWRMVAEVYKEKIDYHAFDKVFLTCKSVPAKRILYLGSAEKRFAELLHSDVELAFCSLTLQHNDTLLIIEPLEANQRGGVDNMSFEANQSLEILRQLREEYPRLPLGLIVTHSHPAMRERFLPKDSELLKDFVTMFDGVDDSKMRGDTSYVDAVLGLIRNWFSPDDREAMRALRSDCQGIGILVWGINYEAEHHLQLRPGYDFVAFRAGLGDDTDELLSITGTNDQVLGPNLGARIITRLQARVRQLMRKDV